MTKFEASQIIVGILQALVGAIGIFFVIRTFKTTNNALEESRRSNEISIKNLDRNTHHQRPWIKISIELEHVERRGDDLYFCVKIKCRNVGLTPAYNFKVGAIVVDVKSIAGQSAFENAASRIPKERTYKQKALFPNNKTINRFNLYFPLHFEDENRRTVKLKDCLPYVIACATYETPFDNETHTSTANGVYAKFPDYENLSSVALENFIADEYELRNTLYDNIID